MASVYSEKTVMIAAYFNRHIMASVKYMLYKNRINYKGIRMRSLKDKKQLVDNKYVVGFINFDGDAQMINVTKKNDVVSVLYPNGVTTTLTLDMFWAMTSLMRECGRLFISKVGVCYVHES